MIRYCILLVGLMGTTLLNAQVPKNRNSVRLGVDLTSLDAPDAVGPRYVGRLARHFSNDRFVVAAEGGYMNKTTSNFPFNDVDPGPNQRERFTADATVLFDLLPHPHHALRLGAGLSAWYRRDDVYRGATALLTPAGLPAVVINRQKLHELNMGAHVAIEYDWLFNERWSADVGFRLADLSKAGISSMLGVGVNYRF